MTTTHDTSASPGLEVPAGHRAEILRRYLAVAPGARPHIPVDRHAPIEELARIAPEIPVFRITSAPEETTTSDAA